MSENIIIILLYLGIWNMFPQVIFGIGFFLLLGQCHPEPNLFGESYNITTLIQLIKER